MSEVTSQPQVPVARGLPVVLLSGAFFFCILFAYYLLRPMREAFGIRENLDELRWLWTVNTFVMLGAVPAFAWLVSRTPRRVFIALSYHVFVVVILAFCALILLSRGPAGYAFQVCTTRLTHGTSAETLVGYVFYIGLSVLNLFMTAVFWGFMADIYERGQAKRVFGLIGVGGTMGAIAGSSVPSALAGGSTMFGIHIQVSPPQLFLGAALYMEVAAWCAHALWRRIGGAGAARQGVGRRDIASATSEPSRDPMAGLRLVATSPYLMAMVVFILFHAITSSLLYFEQGRVVKEVFQDEAARTAAFARIDLATNILTLVTQFFLTAQILRRLGILGGLLIVPIITFVGFGVWWLWPTFGTLFAILVLRRGLHYAVDRPTREVLYTILGPDEKYKSKSFIDTFVVRSGDLAGAWTDKLIREMGGFVWIATGFAGAWIGTAGVLAWLHRREVGKRSSEVAEWQSGEVAK